MRQRKFLLPFPFKYSEIGNFRGVARASFFKGTAGSTQSKIQFKVNKASIKFPNVSHYYSAGFGSFLLIQQLYPPLFTLSIGYVAHQEPDCPFEK